MKINTKHKIVKISECVSNVQNCQTPVLGLGLGVGVDFTFANNNNKNPHLNFLRLNGTMGMKFGTQTLLTKIRSWTIVTEPFKKATFVLVTIVLIQNTLYCQN